MVIFCKNTKLGRYSSTRQQQGHVKPTMLNTGDVFKEKLVVPIIMQLNNICIGIPACLVNRWNQQLLDALEDRLQPFFFFFTARRLMSKLKSA